MNLNQLKVFYLAAKRGNLSLAAADLFITQPAVTKAIQRLQEFYEVKLVNRFGKKLVLTDAGEVLYEIAEKIFDLENHAEESIRDFQKGKKGRVRILSSESFGAYYLPSILNPFISRHNYLTVSVNILPTELVAEKVAGLQADLGFISYPLKHPKLSIQTVLEDQLVLIVPPSHRLAGRPGIRHQDLKGERIITHEKGSTPFKVIFDFLNENRVDVSVTLELSSNRAIKQAVESGLGVALISRHVADEEVEAGRLVALPLLDKPLKRVYCMVYHKDKYISDLLQQFIDRVCSWGEDYSRMISRPAAEAHTSP